MKQWPLAVMIAAVLLVVVGGGYWLVAQLSAPKIPPGAKAWSTDGEAMLPTLQKGDVVFSRSVDETSLKRGMIVVLRYGPQGKIGVFRIAGLPGDRIEFRRGAPVVNGEESVRRGTGGFKTASGQDLFGMIERFPGEAGAHRIGESGFGNMPEMRVGSRRVFLLTDNRSNRESWYASEGLNGTVRLSDILGRVDGIMESKDRSRIGQSLDLPASALNQ